ncbi:Hypothetical protein SRAE_X000218900 [Strongyloides ratti]|uniref:BZIP domain-containing protein n=1 Tax=Strongyloides ratti TaxID=34506 RepID=A0A090KSR7_STRRB|nr:Hypothetical protein SRAE_X000218900 [Strongyloides ratti]CEF60451.1 Hypothetical protein SRAE_X000218900 [Strongyloides ratti]
MNKLHFFISLFLLFFSLFLPKSLEFSDKSLIDLSSFQNVQIPVILNDVEDKNTIQKRQARRRRRKRQRRQARQRKRLLNAVASVNAQLVQLRRQISSLQSQISQMTTPAPAPAPAPAPTPAPG